MTDPELDDLFRRRREILGQVLDLLNEHSELMAPTRTELTEEDRDLELVGPMVASGFVINVVWTDLGNTEDVPEAAMWSRPDSVGVIHSTARGLGLELARL